MVERVEHTELSTKDEKCLSLEIEVCVVLCFARKGWSSVILKGMGS